MAKLLKYVFFLNILSFLSIHYANICKDFTPYACKKNDINYFRETTQKNSRFVLELLSKDEWNYKLAFGQYCRYMEFYNKFMDNLQMIFKDYPVMIRKISYFNVLKQQKPSKRCHLKITFMSSDTTSNTIYKFLHRFGENLKEHDVDLSEINMAEQATNKQKSTKFLRAFFKLNHYRGIVRETAIGKAKHLYRQCNHLQNTQFDDKEGIKEMIKNIHNSFRLVHENINKIRTIPFYTDVLGEFSKGLGEIHLTSATPLFALRPVDLLKKNEIPKKFPAIMQPVFIGDYDKKIHSGKCKISKDDEIKLITQLHEYGEDMKALKKFKILKKLQREITASDTQLLKEVVILEKNLFKFSYPIETTMNHLNIEKNITEFTFGQIKEHFPHIVHWDEYFKTVFSGVKNDFFNDKDKVIVVCKSYFYALDKLLEKTDPKVILEYISLSSVYTMFRKTPQVFPDNIVSDLGLSNGIKCSKIIELSFPHSIGNLLWQKRNIKNISEKIQTLIQHLKKAFVKLVEENKWISDYSKSEALKKVSHIKRVVGIKPEDMDEHHVNLLYKNVQIDPNGSLVKSLINVKTNNFHILLSSVYNENLSNLPMHIIPEEANAFYDIRENLLTINIGLLFPPFIKSDSSEQDIEAGFLLIAGHEIMHSLGRNGIMFDSHGIYVKNEDKKTIRKYREQLSKLENQSNAICRNIEGNPDFKKIREEEIADIGGLKLSMTAYKEIVGDRKYHKTIKTYLEKTMNVFCARKPIITNKTVAHPVQSCRFKLLENTKLFKETFGCREDKNTIDFW